MAASGFDYFVILAGMRTGSNLLEEQINAMPGVSSFGELFNPHFVGKPSQKSCFGIDMATREADPVRLVSAMQQQLKGMAGFRLFYDHDPRVIDHVLNDRRAAKIVLSRRPIDSYVSLKVARKTGQWWLGDMSSAKAAKVSFDATEYAEFLDTLNAFKAKTMRALQTSGQTAFFITYDALSDKEVIAGLGTFLGADGPPDPKKVRAKVQNPSTVASRMKNPGVATDALRALHTTDLDQMPVYEPDRGPGLRLFRTCKTLPLMYMPIRGAGHDPVPEWLKSIDPSGELQSGLTQKDLRKWKRTRPGHLSFTVLRHPLARVYDAFNRFILPEGQDGYEDIRSALVSNYDVPLSCHGKTLDLSAQRHAFLAFLRFLAGNLGGQTSLRVDSTWATQSALVGALGQFSVPDRVIREERLVPELAALANMMGVASPDVGTYTVTTPYPLADVVTKEIQTACKRAYRRDYIMFGFEDWKPPA